MIFANIISRTSLSVCLMFLTLSCISPVGQTMTIVMDNLDPSGDGYNDPTPVTAVGGNSGTTIGQQRINAFNYAATLVSNLLPSSSQVITIGSRFQDLGDCTTDGIFLSVILGGAAPNTVHANFSGTGGLSPLPNTWYPGAIANAIADMDLCPSGSTTCETAPDPITGIPAHLEASAVFNTAIDTSGNICDILTGGTVGWYYGLDGNPPDPNKIDFATIVFHEIAHAVGFVSLVNVSTGQLFMNDPDVFSVHLMENSTGKLLPDMLTNSERSSALTSGDLYWNSPSVVAAFGSEMQMYAPNPVAPGSTGSHFDSSLSSEVMGPGYLAPNHLPGHADELLADLYVQVGCTVSELTESTCSDLIDNDCDGLIDGNDLDCPQPCRATQENELDCQDAVDNDCNGFIDGEDLNCQAICADPACVANELPTEMTCGDGVDNDCDGLVDLNDILDCPGCNPTELPAEISCNDGVDNDCDGFIDLNDSADCSTCTITEFPEVSCADGIDNDCDGSADTADNDCDAPICELADIGESCTVDSECCTNKCRGPSGRKTCR